MLVWDRLGILLALGIGIGGLIFVFSMPDPFTALRPQIPMLSPHDWSGSYASISLGISTEWPWQEKREFHSDLELHAATDSAGIGQVAIWYANPREAAADWDELNGASYKEQPLVSSTGADGKPASMLFCGSGGMELPEGFRECWYLSYWEHWFIEINYRSTLDEDLHAVEMQQIAARVDQLLMSAPNEPCYGVLCTGTKSGIKP